MKFSVIVPLSFRRSGSTAAFCFPTCLSAHSPAALVQAVTFHFTGAICNPGSADQVFSCVPPARPSDKKSHRWCKSSWFAKWRLLWALKRVGFQKPVRNSPAESTLPLPSLHNFELLRSFVRKALHWKMDRFSGSWWLKTVKAK